MKHLLLIGAGISLVACQSTPQTTNQISPTDKPEAPQLTQVISPNAYKVPYLGYNGTFLLNTDQEGSIKDPRNPKRIGISKMEKVTFYKDAAGKSAIARNCTYTYMGAVADPKYYKEFKASWDVFERSAEEKQDPNCKRFHHLAMTAPHGDPIHMHVRYGSEKSSFATLLKMSNDPENAAQFSPWFATYCGEGKAKCGKS